jgi:hypothetical protein
MNRFLSGKLSGFGDKWYGILTTSAHGEKRMGKMRCEPPANAFGVDFANFHEAGGV